MDAAWIYFLIILIITKVSSSDGGAKVLKSNGEWTKIPSRDLWGGECQIRVQSSNRHFSPDATGFIEVNGEKIYTWNATDDADFKIVQIKPSCNEYIAWNFTAPYGIDFFFGLDDALSTTAYGGFVVAASLQGNAQMQRLYPGNSDELEMLERQLASLGMKPYEGCKVTAGGGEFSGHKRRTKSGRGCQWWTEQYPHRHSYVANYDEVMWETAGNECRNPATANRTSPWCYTTDPKTRWEYCDVPMCEQKGEAMAQHNYTWMFISKKGFPGETVSTYEPGDAPPKTIEKTFRIKSHDNCVGPLPPHHWFKQTSRIQPSHPSYTHVDDTNNAFLCPDAVKGWEYIAKQPGEVYLDLFDYYFEYGIIENVSSVALLDSMKLSVTPDGVKDTPQYMCVPEGRPQKYFNKTGYGTYGFHYEDPANSTEVLAVGWSLGGQMSVPCMREQTAHDTHNIMHLPYGESQWVEGLEINIDGASTRSQIALRPIFDSRFVLTCGCTEDRDCQQYGDELMQCEDGKCQCSSTATFSHAWKICVHRDLARQLNVSVYQSSTYDNYTADLAVDDSTERVTGIPSSLTCSSTQPGSQHWYLLDMGRPVQLFGLRVRVPKPQKNFGNFYDKSGRCLRMEPTKKKVIAGNSSSCTNTFYWDHRSVIKLSKAKIESQIEGLAVKDDGTVCVGDNPIQLGLRDENMATVPVFEINKQGVFLFPENSTKCLGWTNQTVDRILTIVALPNCELFYFKPEKEAIWPRSFSLRATTSKSISTGVLTLPYTDMSPPLQDLCAQSQPTNLPTSSVGVLDLAAGYVKVDAYDDNRDPAVDEVKLTLSEGGLSNFVVGVATNVIFLDGSPVDSPPDFTPCLRYHGFADPDGQTYLDCEDIMTGRYVAIYTEPELAKKVHPMQLCDVEVLGLLPHVAGRPCEKDTDCSSEQNFKCGPVSHTCSCMMGYQLQEHYCVDINECEAGEVCASEEEDGNSTAVNVTCVNTPGSYMCTCQPGYIWDGNTCTDINECEMLVTECAQHSGVCVNRPGSYECTCRNGYIRGCSGKTCFAHVESEMLLLEAYVGLMFLPEYGDISSMEAQALKQAIEITINRILREDDRLNDLGIYSAEVVNNFFPHTGFHLLLRLWEPLEQATQDYIAWILWRVMAEQTLDLNGTEVSFVSATRIMYDVNGTQISVGIASPCDNGYCQNGGLCEIWNSIATCRCVAGFRGERCEEENEGIDSGILLLVIASSLAVILLAALVIGACCHCRRKREERVPVIMRPLIIEKVYGRGIWGCQPGRIWTSRPGSYDDARDQYYYGN